MRRPSNRALHAALSGWLVGLLAVGPAAAQQQQMPLRLVPRALPAATGPRVTVVAVAVDAAVRDEALRLAYWAEQAVARSGTLELVRLADALDSTGTAARQAKAQEAAAAFKEGLRAYDELDTQNALQQFDKAVRAYEQSDLSLHFGDLSRARVMKAASQVANGENKAAELEMRAVLSVDPRAQFSPNYFPPEEVALAEKERKALLAGAQGSLQVRTAPVPAQVYVDGAFRGVTPVALTGLPAADHYVTLVAPGYAVTQGRARDAEASFTPQKLPVLTRLESLTQRIAKNPNGPDRDRALAELGALAGTPQVLALLVRGGPGSTPLEVTALRLDAADGHNLAYAVGPVPRGDAMATGSQALLSGLVVSDTPRVNGKPVSHFSGGASAGRRTAGYVLMAAGVAMLAGGIYFGLEAASKEDAFKSTPQTSPRAQDLKDTGKTYALVADVGVILGLASAGVGGYLAFAGGGGGSSSASRASRPASAPATAAPPPATRPAPTSKSLELPPPPKGTAPTPRESLPMPPPPSRAGSGSTGTGTSSGTGKASPPAPVAPTPPPAPPSRPETRREREEAEKRKREEEEARLKREEEARRQQEEAEKRKREEEEKRKREEEEKRKREEEKKKKPSLDEDDLRNY